MPTSRRTTSPTDELTDALRAFALRRLVDFAGFALIAIALALTLALATWSVEDPSLNHAVDGPVRNLLGYPGAVASDLLMQLVGLGSLAILLPLAVWGWRLLRRGRLARMQLRLALFVLGAGAATAVASALPSTARWPLPTGLGGVTGDALLGAAQAVTGLGGGPAATILGFSFAVIAILAVTGACGFGVSEEDGELEHEPEYEAEAPAQRRRGPVDLDDFDDAPRDDEPGRAIVWLGAAAHALLSMRVQLRRAGSAVRDALAARLSRPDDEFAYAGGASRRGHREPELGDFVRPARQGVRREPIISPAPAHAAAERPALPRETRYCEPEQVDDDYRAYEDDYRSDPGPAASEPPAPSRVTMPVATPKPGKRLSREAQPSFLDEDRNDYELPALTLLTEPKGSNLVNVSAESLEQNAAMLESTLEDFGVRGEIINVRPGPVVTLYELEPAPGTKSSRVIGLADDIARSMSAVSARVAVVQGRNAIGIELPNARRDTVYLRELLASRDFEASKQKLALCLGKTIGGEPVIADLARMPHLLVAGTTGSGKSVAINTMILSLLYRHTPEQCRLIMVDPKMLELSVYDGIPHLLSPVVTDPKKAVVALKWAVREMEDRYRKMSKLGVRNIDGFNARVAEASARGEVITRSVQTGFDRDTGSQVYEDQEMCLDPLPYIVVIVDEMADLMMVAGKDIEGAIQRLAQMARAAGIHLIMATQRPSVDVITGTIKANFPTRISFQVTSKIDSRTILGEMGAEQLLGQGDMLYMAGGGRITRVHGPFVSDDEVEKVVAHLKTQGRPSYLEAVTSDEEEAGAAGEDDAVFDKGSFGEPGGDLYDQAVALVLRDKKASTSYIQRRLQIGYNRAASLMERMENDGIVGAANHAGKREILIEGGDRRRDEDEDDY
ncbi:MAG: DNA translocase FtsK [Salinarimonadaceae bacterium]|nr:MAG: DNA translocase FtsK [Salinarimonadaceae bacterium]